MPVVSIIAFESGLSFGEMGLHASCGYLQVGESYPVATHMEPRVDNVSSVKLKRIGGGNP